MTCYFILNLNESVVLVAVKSTILLALFTAGISLQYCHKLPDAFEQLSLYYIKLYIGITISMHSALSTSVLFILLIQLINGA